MKKATKKDIIKYIEEINNKYQEENQKLLDSGDYKSLAHYPRLNSIDIERRMSTVSSVIRWLVEEIENDEALPPTIFIL